MNKHYTFEDEGAEFEAGDAITRYDLYYQLDHLQELISELDYKDEIDSVMMKEISHDFCKIIRFMTTKSVQK